MIPLWQAVIFCGVCFVLGFQAGAWIQRQEEPISETEGSLNKKIAERIKDGI